MRRELTVLLTRTEEDNQQMIPLFEEHGMQVVSLPMIAVQDIPFSVEKIPETTSTCVLLTSRKGTERWLRLREEHESVREIEVYGYMIVGKRSEEMMLSAEEDARVLVVAESGKELVERVREGMGRQGEGETRREGEVLYPCSRVRRDEVVKGLGEIGYRVVEIPLYEPVLPEESREELSAVLKRVHEESIVVFFSPSAVQNFFSIWDGNREGLRFAAIGRTTAMALESQGVTNIILPERPDVRSLIQSLIGDS